MTYQFTKSDWEQSGQAYKLELQFDSSSEMPIVQVYKHEQGVAIQQICTIIVNAKFTTIISITPFDGVAVIK